MSRFSVTLFAFVFAIEEVVGSFDSCVHGGTNYAEGDYFLPNDTIIKTESPRECVQCRCRRGLVLCEIETCPTLECEMPSRNPRLCCLLCPGSKERKEETSDFVFGNIGSGLDPEASTKKNCIWDEKHFEDGSVWQPVMGPFGVMACVQCGCRNGVITCDRVKCNRLSCPHPRRELGRCCPVCPHSAENKRKAFCLPKSSEVFVFKTPNVRNNSDKIEYAFVENKRNGDMVRIHGWNLKARTSAEVFTFSLVSLEDFHERSFHLLGSITKKRLRKYSKREKKLRNNCLKKCLTKIERLENSLVDYSVNARHKCVEDEVDVSAVYGEPSGKGPRTKEWIESETGRSSEGKP